MLAGACSGQTVRAELAPAANYAGVKESNVANNIIQTMACGPIDETPAPSLARLAPPAGDVTATGTFIAPRVEANDATRAILAPEVRTTQVTPNATAVTERPRRRPWFYVDGAACRLAPGSQRRRVLDGDGTAVNFDLRFLHEVPGMRVREAVLQHEPERRKGAVDPPRGRVLQIG